MLHYGIGLSFTNAWKSMCLKNAQLPCWSSNRSEGGALEMNLRILLHTGNKAHWSIVTAYWRYVLVIRNQLISLETDHMVSLTNEFGFAVFHWQQNTPRCVRISYRQECIPVGCIPPAAVAVRGGLHQAHPREQTPRSRPPRPATLWEQAPPWDSTHTPSCCKACWDTTCDACWDSTPLWTEWQTRVKILPCPKLRLRAVTSLGLCAVQKFRKWK